MRRALVTFGVALATAVSGAMLAPAGTAASPKSADSSVLTRLGTTIDTVAANAATNPATTAVKTAAAARWKPPQGAFFNKPRSRAATQFRLERQVLNAIRHTPRGGLIRIATFSYDRGPVTDALINARKRGVRVQVIVNGHEWSSAQRRLRKKLGGNRFRKNFHYQCKNGSCRARGDAQHSKFYLFSRSGSARKVVMLGSINMKLNGHKNQYNDLWVRNGSPDLYDFLWTTFEQMRKDRVFRPGYRHKTFWKGTFDAHVLPFSGAWRADPIRKALAPVKCRGAKGTYQGRTAIRVNMHAWDGDRGARIAKRLRNLYGAGCNVKIQYGMGGKKVRQVLAVKTRRGLVPVRSNGFDTNGDGQLDLYSHQKVLAINGRYAHHRSVKLTYTGSSNYQDSGAYGDEIIFRTKGRGNHTRYINNWDWMWKNKTRKVPWMRSRVVVLRSIDGETTRIEQPPILSDPLSDNTLPLADTQG